ncbi:MAG TPA: ADP-ribosylglycohydrolase family protein [Candidatus Babeliales bacterium]|nr:ADP-ribosylglycohydrolase family protein [Candidatus Babeliales bacterium]
MNIYTVLHNKALSLSLSVTFLISGTQILSHDNKTYDYSNAFAGSMLAGGIGDALGRVTEFIPSTDAIFQRYPGGVRSYDDFLVDDWKYVPAVLKNKKIKIAPYTDDTAMAKLVMKELIQAREHNWDLDETMCHIATSFIDDAQDTELGWIAKFRAPGNACIAGVNQLRKNISSGVWDVKAHTAGGCGSVMRAHPFGLVFADNPEKAAAWAVAHSRLTHGDPIALAACAAMAKGVAYAVQGENPHIIIEKMIAAARAYDAVTAQKMQTAYTYAQQAKTYKGRDFEQFNNKVFNTFLGWAAHDAIAATVYTFALSPDNVMDAIYLGVHTPGDSDSIASMAGALVGARVGAQSLPQDLVDRLENSAELKADAEKAACLLKSS